MRRYRVAAPLLVGLAVGSALTVAAYRTLRGSETVEQGALHLGQRELINPLLACPFNPKGGSPSKAALTAKLEAVIREFEQSDSVQEVAVLFRDLNNGPGISINQKAPFIAASLLKLPILISFFKQKASTPELFDSQVKFSAKSDGHLERRPTITSQHAPMVDGQEYSVGELLTRMIVDSDNVATAVLMKHFPGINSADTLRDMGIPVTMKGDELWINVEDYAFMFRILYNATYLGAEHSNAALAILTRTEFELGLVSGVGKKYSVAHKFGERQIGDLQQFHDCGIVYFPSRPYLLCVMTRGTKQPALIKVISTISKAVFDQVEKDANVH